jgi:hypothetical protein
VSLLLTAGAAAGPTAGAAAGASAGGAIFLLDNPFMYALVSSFASALGFTSIGFLIFLVAFICAINSAYCASSGSAPSGAPFFLRVCLVAGVLGVLGVPISNCMGSRFVSTCIFALACRGPAAGPAAGPVGAVAGGGAVGGGAGPCSVIYPSAIEVGAFKLDSMCCFIIF